MTGRRFIGPDTGFEAQIGGSRAVVDGEWVFVSGTGGFDPAGMTIADDIVAQAGQCLDNIAAALREAGAGFDDVVRLTCIVAADDEEFERCRPLLRQRLGGARPAVTLLRAGLLDPRMKIGIEVTARKRRPCLGGEAPSP